MVDLLPTELPSVEVSRNEMDLVFLLEDNTCLHLELQSSPTDLGRFLLYDSRLWLRDQRPIRTVVLYTGGIQDAPEAIDTLSVQYRVQNVYLSQFDGNAERARIRTILRAQTWLPPEDQVDLAFSILMHNEGGVYPATLEAKELVQGMEDPVSRDFLLGCFVGLSDKFLSEEQRKTVRGRIRVTRIGQELIEEGRLEGRLEGRQEGRMEGQVNALRENILEAWEARFDEVPEGIRTKVLTSEDPEALRLWFRAVLGAESAAEATWQIQGFRN